MTTQYLDLVDYLAVAAEVTGLDVDTGHDWGPDEMAAWLRKHLSAPGADS